MSALLGAHCGYRHILLEQQAYSLVWASVGLFVLSTVFMYLTRDVVWYAQEEQARAAATGDSDVAESTRLA